MMGSKYKGILWSHVKECHHPRADVLIPRSLFQAIEWKNKREVQSRKCNWGSLRTCLKNLSAWHV